MYGQRIKQLRITHKLTQDELAEELSVSPKTIGSWEREERKPSIDVIRTMAKLFSVTTDYLLGTDNGINHKSNKDETHTIAAHLDKDLSDKDKQEIMSFIDYIKHRDHSSDSDK